MQCQRPSERSQNERDGDEVSGRTAVRMPLPDVVTPGLDAPFCGINTSTTSAARSHHLARPGNRFWPAPHPAGLAPRRLTSAEDRELLRYGMGVTNVAARSTRTPAELSAAELRQAPGSTRTRSLLLNGRRR